MIHRRSIGRGRVGLGLTRVTTSGGRGVDGLSRVGHLGNIAIGVVGSVGDSLDPAVREGNSVRAANNTVGIPRFSSVEVCLGVVVRDTIGEGVWLRGLLGILHRGMICRCRCVVDRGSVVGRGRGMVDSWGRDMVGSRGSMDNSMVAMADAMAVSNAVSNVGHMRHRGSAGQTKKGRDHEGLKNEGLA